MSQRKTPSASVDPEVYEEVRRRRALLRSLWTLLTERIDRGIGDTLPAEISEDELTCLAEQAIQESRRRRSR